MEVQKNPHLAHLAPPLRIPRPPHHGLGDDEPNQQNCELI